ncbi:MAG: ABC transporter permease [Tissierellia bacterium]|nr:ABC transporter permease [Tissierellia bacterium]
MDNVKTQGKPSFLGRILKSEMLYNFKHNLPAIIGTIIFLTTVIVAIIGPNFTPQDPYNMAELSISNSYLPPFWAEGGSTEFLLGTDTQGRDIFSAIVYGSRISLFIGITAMSISCIIGTVLGLISGYYGGIIDDIIMRIIDIQLSFPTTLLAIFIMTIFGRGIDKIIFALILVGWVSYARTVRGEVLGVKNKEYVDAGRTIGLPDRIIMFKHILPNVLTSVVVLSTIQVGSFILTEATLSFLGVGVEISKPSLGLLVKNGFDVMFSGLWWVSFFPGLYIMLIVFGINLLGDFLRDELNPRLK